MREDNLTDLFAPAPPGPAQPMQYRQGVIIDWDPITLSNKVQVGHATLTNLPVLGIAEAASYRTGVTVGIAAVGNTWGIIGRWVVPNTPDAVDAITQLSSRTKTQTIPTQETTTSFAWTDLATVGPSVTVDIGASRRALMILSAKGGWSLVGADIYQGAFMSVALSGANTKAPLLEYGAWIESQHGDTTFVLTSATIAGSYTFEDLTPGPTTFTAKYSTGADGVLADFSRRTLTVIAL